MSGLLRLFTLLSLAGLLVACDQGPEVAPPEQDERCIIPTQQFSYSVPRDAIIALQDPEWTTADQVSYVQDWELVLGLRVGDEHFAIPHNILNYHEIINLNSFDPPLSVTYCPLTGSGIVFERENVEGAEFGVSGLLWLNNNVLYDRRDSVSFWSQMWGRAICGEESEKQSVLTPYPVVEMNWEGWKELHPDAKVLSEDTGHDRDYAVDPIGGYRDPSNDLLFWPMPFPVDQRRLPKERVLGIPDDLGGKSYPLEELDVTAPFTVVHDTLNGEPLVVFFDRFKYAATAFWLKDDHAGKSFDIVDEQIQDVETGSVWNIEGMAYEGALAGTRLEQIPESYIAYWFAWAAFHPETEIYDVPF